MILWLTIAQIAVAVAAGIFCIVAGLSGRRPSDISVGALALVEVLLVVQVIVAIVAPLAGNPPTGTCSSTGSTWCRRCSCPSEPCCGRSWSAAGGAR